MSDGRFPIPVIEHGYDKIRVLVWEDGEPAEVEHLGRVWLTDDEARQLLTDPDILLVTPPSKWSGEFVRVRRPEEEKTRA